MSAAVLAGTSAALVSLGVNEVIAALIHGAGSVLGAVGNDVRSFTVVVVWVAIGGALGILGRGDFRLAAVGSAAGAALAWSVTTADPAVSPAIAAVGIAAAVAIGLAILWVLLAPTMTASGAAIDGAVVPGDGRAPTEVHRASATGSGGGRRRFLGLVAAAAGLGLGSTALARLLLARPAGDMRDAGAGAPKPSSATASPQSARAPHPTHDRRGLASTPRSSTLTVAASDASNFSRDGADYLCDGTDDQAEIQAALDALPETGGKVVLTEGTFNIAAPIRIEKHGVTFEGFGYGHETGLAHDSRGTKLQAVRGLTDQMILVEAAEGANRMLQGIQLRYFVMDGGNLDGAIDGVFYRSYRGQVFSVHIWNFSGNGIQVRGDEDVDWGTYDTVLSHLQIGKCGAAGVWFNLRAIDCHLLASIIQENEDGIRISAASQQITGCHLYSNARYNVWFDSAGARTKLANCKVEQAGRHGVFLDSTDGGGPTDVTIVGCNFKNSGTSSNDTYDHINISGTRGNTTDRTTIVGNAFSHETVAQKPHYAINFSETAVGCIAVGNSFGPPSQWGTAAVNNGGKDCIVRDNVNWKTEASGTATIDGGSTSVDVTHGLSVPPSLRDVTVTPTNHLGASTKWWVSAVSATTFTISVDADPGSGGASFAWQAHSL